MTVEELKETAKEMGYKLMPIAPHEKLKACRCGCKKRRRIYGCDDLMIVCMRCGLSAYGSTEAEARKNWNAMVRGEHEDQKMPEVSLR